MILSGKSAPEEYVPIKDRGRDDPALYGFFQEIIRR
jgi:hypothetical protein